MSFLIIIILMSSLTISMILVMVMIIAIKMILVMIKRCKSAYAAQNQTVTDKQVCAGGQWKKVTTKTIITKRMAVMMMMMAMSVMMVMMAMSVMMMMTIIIFTGLVHW